jgi:hypothetical protein
VSQEVVGLRVDGCSLVRVVVGIRSSGEAHHRPPLGLAHLVALEVRASRVPLAAHGPLVSPNAAGQSAPWDDVNDLVDEPLRPFTPERSAPGPSEGGE